MKPLLITLFLALYANIGFSQVENLQRLGENDLFVERYTSLNYFERRELAVNISKDLKKGTLIVRLNANKGKIDKLIEFRRMKDATLVRKQLEAENKDFMEKFKYYYTFSDVLFVYGYMLPDYLDGKITDIFLDENLEVDSSIKPKEGSIYYYGAQSSHLYYLLDREFNVIEAPAPYAVYSGAKSSNVFMGYSKTRGVEYLNKRLLKLSEISLKAQ